MANPSKTCKITSKELKDLEILLVLNAQLKSGLFTNALRYLISV